MFVNIEYSRSKQFSRVEYSVTEILVTTLFDMSPKGKQKPQNFLMGYEKYPCIKKLKKSRVPCLLHCMPKIFLCPMVENTSLSHILGPDLHKNRAPKKNSLTSMGVSREKKEARSQIKRKIPLHHNKMHLKRKLVLFCYKDC